MIIHLDLDSGGIHIKKNNDIKDTGFLKKKNGVDQGYKT